jgi:hypothetical protein
VNVLVRILEGMVYRCLLLELNVGPFTKLFTNDQGPDFDDMSSFFSCEVDDAIQYINLGYGAHAPTIVIL